MAPGSIRSEARELFSDARLGSNIEEQFEHGQRPRLLKHLRDRLIGRRKKLAGVRATFLLGAAVTGSEADVLRELVTQTVSGKEHGGRQAAARSKLHGSDGEQTQRGLGARPGSALAGHSRNGRHPSRGNGQQVS